MRFRRLRCLSLPVVVLLPLLLSSVSTATEPHTTHTLRLTDGEQPPAATLDDVSWLVGSWTGTAFGKTFEEEWSSPSAGSMIGTFKLIDGDAVSFYELMMLSVDDGRLSLKVKHFNADFTAWEDKDDYVDFKLVALDDDELHFHGLSFYRRDDNVIDGYIVMQTNDGVREEKLVYRRRP